MFGNLPKGLTPFDKTSSYWLEVSTHDQKIQFHTSKSNGEPYTYDVIFDTSNGNFTIQDDAGNSILLDSPSSTIGAFNASGSFIKMVGPDISMNAPGSFTINGQRYTLTSEQNTVNGTTDVNGVSNLNQGINVKGDNGSGKTGTFEGSLNMTGRMEADQGFETPSDIHAGGAIRSDTSVSSPSTH